MSLNINWSTKVINIPQAYLSNLGGGVYGLDLEQMHYDLRALEAGEIGIPMEYTHDHNPEVTLSGAVYSRFIIFVNGYTVTFEDGQYAVNATGANSNIADVMNVNQVSLRTFNSAGLITVTSGSGVLPQDILDIADQVWNETLADHLGTGSTGAKLNEGATVDADTIADAVWDEDIADHLSAGTTGAKLNEGSTVDASEIAAAVWDMVIYPDHITNDTAGKYIYEFYRLVEEGDIYVSTSTSSEIMMVRDRLGDAGVLITETVVDEEAISTDTDTVFPAERLIYDISGVWLASDPTHAGTNYYEGANGEFDSYTGKISLHTSLPDDNSEVLISYTFMRGLPDNVIDQFLVEAKLYVKKYTRKDYDWSLGLGATPDEETQIALLAACSLAAMRCLEAIATGDILQFGYNFRLGDLQVESMTSGGFHVQAHIDFLKNDVDRKLAMLGRAMYFVARTTRSYGRDAWGYKRQSGGGYKVY